MKIIMLFLCFFMTVKADELFLPKNKYDTSKLPPFTSNLLKEQREHEEERERSSVEKIVKKIVQSDKKELEEEAEQISKDKKKLDQLLSVFSKEEPCDISKDIKFVLESFYLDPELREKTVSIKLKDASLRETIELIGKAADLDFIIDPNVHGVISNIHLKNVSVSSALNIILSSSKPRLVFIKDLGIWRILRLKDAIPFLRMKAKELEDKDFQSDFVTIYNAKWTESFKLRIEKMWNGILGEHSNKSGFYIVFDDNVHKIFFRAKKREVEEFKFFLKQVDTKIPQVRIEARVIIAGKDFEESFGLQVSGIYNRSSSINNSGWNPIGFGNIKSAGGAADIASGNLMDWALNLLPQASSKFLNLPIVFGGKNLDTKRLNLVLNAAESKSEIETILKPTLLVNSEEPAEILVGQEVPIQTSIQERIEGSLRDINTVNYKDLGMKLKVKPIVTPDQKSIFLDIFVENSYLKSGSIATSFDAKKDIIVSTKSKSRVLLKSGQTTLIGGLISNEKRKEKNGIPLLQEIPLLGHLFRGSKKYKRDDQLMIFISPTVI